LIVLLKDRLIKASRRLIELMESFVKVCVKSLGAKFVTENGLAQSLYENLQILDQIKQ
jgi:hypothetical protein